MAKNIKKKRDSPPTPLHERGGKRSEKKVFYKSTPKKQQKQKRNPKNELTGIYKQGQGNFGFVDTIDSKTGEKKGYFVHESKKLDAFEGDEVAFEVQYFKGRPEAIIKKVLKRSEHLIIGILKIQKTFAFVITESPLVKNDIFIPGKHIGGYIDGSRVAVQILRWEGKNPEGRIIESLESLPKGREDIYKIAFEMGARRSFSEKVKQEVKHLPREITQTDIKYREDFRKMLTYTIDGAESKDLDDALSIEIIYETPPVASDIPLDEGEQNKSSLIEGGGRRSEGVIKGYRLYVHIADVSHYVKENTSLDREARKRATSIYLVDQVIPMLPVELSNGLCSLHPGEDKLTMTCILETDMQGRVLSSSVKNSIIQSDFRLTYKEIDAILTPPPAAAGIPLIEEEQDKSPSSREMSEKRRQRELGLGDTLQFGGTLTQELSKNISILKEFTDILQKNTYMRGSLDFDFPETKILLDDVGNPVEYTRYERYDSYKIIEVCMVLANEYVARIGYKHPFLYRVHELPDEEDVEKFGKIIAGVSLSQFSPQRRDEAAASFSLREKEFWPLGHPLGDKIEGSIKPKHFQQILEELKKTPKLQYFQKLLLRSLTKAKYSDKNLGHFGLALEYYSHFTSPIRRYSDLQVHRILKEIIAPPHATAGIPLDEGEQNTSSLIEGGGGVKAKSEGVKMRGLRADRKQHYKEILPKVAQACSEKSDKAEKMEYKVRDMMACKYMQGKEGEEFTGKISGMIEKGFFIELPNTIEGFIDFGLTGLEHNSENFTILQTASGKELHFGDEVQVRLVHIDEQRMRLEFEIV